MYLRCFQRAAVVLGTLAMTFAGFGTFSFGAADEAKPKSKTETEVNDFALIDHQGAFRHLYYYAKDPRTRAIVLFVQGNGCPLVRKQVPQFKRLRDTYATNGVLFWMINANRQ